MLVDGVCDELYLAARLGGRTLMQQNETQTLDSIMVGFPEQLCQPRGLQRAHST